MSAVSAIQEQKENVRSTLVVYRDYLATELCKEGT